MRIVEIGIAVAGVLSILAFLTYVAGLLRLQSHGRPRTPTFDRFGDSLPPRENPGFEETEEEHEAP